MQTLIENYINGNLTFAKAKARRFGWTRLVLGLQEWGYGPNAAIHIAAFLKGQGSFQAACDAEHMEKQTA